jgi:hypothetical protein
VTLDSLDRHAAYCAGLSDGIARRVDADVEDRVRSLLHDRALEALGMARRHAAAKGPAWSQMIAECGEDQ